MHRERLCSQVITCVEPPLSPRPVRKDTRNDRNTPAPRPSACLLSRCRAAQAIAAPPAIEVERACFCGSAKSSTIPLCVFLRPGAAGLALALGFWRLLPGLALLSRLQHPPEPVSSYYPARLCLENTPLSRCSM